VGKLFEMSHPQGIIAVMGSGETTDSMVRVHRYLLSKLPQPVKAVFVDTPAGFQANADDLYEKSKEYFGKHLQQSLEQVSFKSARNISPFEREKAILTLKEAGYIFVGPGSPTYALKNWVDTPIPQIISDRIQDGACFIAASAAALTTGKFTVPVYEIYKVGEEVHWVEGLNLFGFFGLPLVIIPHWNNAEGGTHDTRFCYLGETRLAQMEAMLPAQTPILGVDEHTACIFDFQERRVLIRGVGGVTVRRQGKEKSFRDGETLPLEDFRKFAGLAKGKNIPELSRAEPQERAPEPSLAQIRAFQDSFEKSLREHKGDAVVDAIISLEKMIWKPCQGFEDDDHRISQGREALREMIVKLGVRFDEAPQDIPSVMAPVLDILLDMRGKLREAKMWSLADRMRDRLLQAGIVVEDTPEGPRWRMKAET
jgi:peptidase E